MVFLEHSVPGLPSDSKFVRFLGRVLGPVSGFIFVVVVALVLGVWPGPGLYDNTARLVPGAQLSHSGNAQL